MATMNISLPDDLMAYVDQRVSSGGYGSSSDYVRALIEREQSGVDHLRQLLLDGAASPPAGPADDAYFDRLRARIAERAAKRA
jgi:antitoxin ParD1/3/4